MAEKLGDVEAIGDGCDDFLRRLRSRLEEVVAGADARSAGQSAGSIGRGGKAELLRGVGIQQIRLEHTLFDHHGTACGDTLAIEGTGAEAAAHGAIIDHGDLVTGDFLLQFAGEERGTAVYGVPVDSLEDVAQDGVRDQGIEDDRDLRGLRPTSAQTAKRSLGSNLAYVLGRIQTAEVAGDREPVVTLHGAVFGAGNGHRGHRTIGAAVLADESMGIGQDFVSGGGVEGAAFGVLDARIVVERGFFGAAGVLDALFAGQ